MRDIEPELVSQIRITSSAKPAATKRESALIVIEDIGGVAPSGHAGNPVSIFRTLPVAGSTTYSPECSTRKALRPSPLTLYIRDSTVSGRGVKVPAGI